MECLETLSPKQPGRVKIKTQMESFHLFFGPNLGHKVFTKFLQAKKSQHAVVKG